MPIVAPDVAAETVFLRAHRECPQRERKTIAGHMIIVSAVATVYNLDNQLLLGLYGPISVQYVGTLSATLCPCGRIT